MQSQNFVIKVTELCQMYVKNVYKMFSKLLF